MNPKITHREFCMIDPYNPQNEVEGIIHLTNDAYGDLDIQRVNGEACSQEIRTTPKFYYPGGKTSPTSEVTPKDFPDEPFAVFNKWDGTNIFLFRYQNHLGDEFVSFEASPP